MLFISETDIRRWQIHSQNRFTSIRTHSTIFQTSLKTTKIPIIMHLYQAIDDFTFSEPTPFQLPTVTRISLFTRPDSSKTSTLYKSRSPHHHHFFSKTVVKTQPWQWINNCHFDIVFLREAIISNVKNVRLQHRHMANRRRLHSSMAWFTTDWSSKQWHIYYVISSTFFM